jgi:hypothetical protein
MHIAFLVITNLFAAMGVFAGLGGRGGNDAPA